MKLRNIAVSYTLPDGKLSNLGVESARINFIADNLFVWTPYDKKNRNSYKQSMSGYPMETSFSLGLDLSF